MPEIKPKMTIIVQAITAYTDTKIIPAGTKHRPSMHKPPATAKSAISRSFKLQFDMLFSIKILFILKKSDFHTGLYWSDVQLPERLTTPNCVILSPLSYPLKPISGVTEVKAQVYLEVPVSSKPNCLIDVLAPFTTIDSFTTCCVLDKTSIEAMPDAESIIVELQIFVAETTIEPIPGIQVRSASSGEGFVK